MTGEPVRELEVEVNPPGIEAEYLDGLAASFGDWGGHAEFAWDFQREAGARVADLMVLRDEGRIVAGSAVSYRTVRHGDRSLLIGIMTGSWTRPEARGRGAFTRVIEVSRDLVVERGGDVLVAFVTQDNASRRRLVAAGCAEVPSWYVASTEATPPPAGAGVPEALDAAAADLHGRFTAWQTGGPGAWVDYRSLAEWTSQYLERPLPVEVLDAGGCPCIVERSPRSDRLLWAGGARPAAAIPPLLARAILTGRQLFVYTMEDAMRAACEELGMVAKPGSLTVLGVGPRAETPTPGAGAPLAWRIVGGDRA